MYGERKRPMIVICPGGGYEHVSPREGEAIALQFMTTGAHAAVLKMMCQGRGRVPAASVGTGSICSLCEKTCSRILH